MLTLIFLTLAALGGAGIGYRCGYQRGAVFGARYGARQAILRLRAQLDESAAEA